MSYSGQDFPATTPGTELLYPLDFTDLIELRRSQAVTLGGTATLGDVVGINFTELSLPDAPYAALYTVTTGDTIDSIATALAAKINGDPNLAAAGIEATVSGDVVTISYLDTTTISFASVLLPASNCTTLACTAPRATETMAFAAGPLSGETITSALWTCEVYLGGTDSDPSSRIIGDAVISGATVSTVAGNFVAGNTYRLTCTVETAEQPSVQLYSHVACALPL